MTVLRSTFRCQQVVPSLPLKHVGALGIFASAPFPDDLRIGKPLPGIDVHPALPNRLAVRQVIGACLIYAFVRVKEQGRIDPALLHPHWVRPLPINIVCPDKEISAMAEVRG